MTWTPNGRGGNSTQALVYPTICIKSNKRRQKMKSISRREFLRLAGIGGAGMLAAACGATPAPQQVVETVVVKETVVVEGTPQVVEKVVE